MCGNKKGLIRLKKCSAVCEVRVREGLDRRNEGEVDWVKVCYFFRQIG